MHKIYQKDQQIHQDLLIQFFYIVTTDMFQPLVAIFRVVRTRISI
jgi:hypothetical protein